MNQDIYVVIEYLQNKVADISFIMLAVGREIANHTGGKVNAVLLGNNAQGLAANLAADKVVYLDHPALAEFTSDAYQKALDKLILETQPRVVLFGNTSIGSDLASVLSARLDLPLINSCQSIGADGEIISKLFGGKIMTERTLPDTTTLITAIPGGYKPEAGQTTSPAPLEAFAPPALDNLRVSLKSYIEPEAGDVDISKEAILVGVGRGISNIDNIELAEELAEALGGAVCASRPVVDLGWLPTSRLVGKSGLKIKPKLYFTLGISGAPEHVEAITDAEVIIAINTDANAPIYDIAKYGAEIDMFDLVEVLTEKINDAKHG